MTNREHAEAAFKELLRRAIPRTKLSDEELDRLVAEVVWNLLEAARQQPAIRS